jgi:hypothetical protein
MFLKLLRDPSETWRIDVYGQSIGEQDWLPLFSKVVGLSDDTSDAERVSPESGKLPLLPLVESGVVENESMRVLDRVEGRWL